MEQDNGRTNMMSGQSSARVKGNSLCLFLGAIIGYEVTLYNHYN